MTESPILQNFEYYAPTKLFFGEGQLKNINKYLNFAQRILVVTGRKGAEESGALRTIKDTLHDRDLIFFNKITSNPKTIEINEGSDLGRNFKADVVIGIGGGSAIDAAKAIAACIPINGSVEDLLQNKITLPENTLPIVAVPTTAGTGAEMSKGAIITDPELVKKGGLRGDLILPKLAIVDPELTFTLPHTITVETGFDVFTHALETFISKKANAVTSIISEYIIKKVIVYLPKLLMNLNDKEARRHLMLASTLAGINLANSSTCLPHRLQYPLGAQTDCSHAKGLASLYKAWISSTVPYAQQKFSMIMDWFQETNSNENKEIKNRPYSVIDKIEKFMKEIGIDQRIRDFGISEDLCEDLANEVEGNLSLDPGDTSIEALKNIYKKSW